MRVRFWGVRGSIPTPGPLTAVYGGNTTCLQATLPDGRVVVLDAGTGIRPLGNHLMATKGPKDLLILITHTHWDHIQGFPFFVPVYVPGFKIRVCGPSHFDASKTLDKIMALQMDYTYFPVPLGALKSSLNFEGIKEGDLDFEGLTVKARVMNHPITVLGYRLEHQGKVFVFTGDHEPFYNPYQFDDKGTVLGLDNGEDDEDDEDFREAEQAAAEGNEKVAELCVNADLLVCDSQYTPQDYESHRGWGHSSWQQVVDLAARAGAKRLALTHHDPERTDEKLAAVETEAKAYAAKQAPGLEVFSAREGLEITL